MVTGLGAVTPVGIGAHVAFKALCEGKNGIQRLPAWADEYPAKLAGVVDFDAKANGLKPKTVNRNGRYTHFAMAAAKQVKYLWHNILSKSTSLSTCSSIKFI